MVSVHMLRCMQIRPKPNAIYDYCRESGISRDELSRRMGVATTTTYRVDSGQVEPSTRFIAAMMNLSGRKFEDLFEVVEVAA
jgi:predicted transcriptional regulator